MVDVVVCDVVSAVKGNLVGVVVGNVVCVQTEKKK